METNIYKFEPLRDLHIRRRAEEVRGLLKAPTQIAFPVHSVLDQVLDQQLNMVRFVAHDYDEYDAAEGVTYVSNGMPVISIRNEVYENACDGDGDARFTIAHEIGHLFLHVPLISDTAAAQCDEFLGRHEQEADAFAMELLMPAGSISQGSTQGHIANTFKVSHEAANERYAYLKARNLLSVSGRSEWGFQTTGKQRVS